MCSTVVGFQSTNLPLENEEIIIHIRSDLPSLLARRTFSITL
jgi:hypothetical protein